MPTRTITTLTVALVLALSACKGSGTAPAPTPKPKPTPETRPIPDPVLPDEGDHLAPSLTRLTKDTPKVDEAVLLEVGKCKECHAEAVEEWGQSMHAFASFNNPLYITTLDHFAAHKDPKAARFCNTCHDVGVQFHDPPVPPAEDDPRGLAGVTCAVCHGIANATFDGNGSYTLTTAPIPYPTPGDADSLARHKARMAPKALKSNEMCVSCHRGFVGHATGHPFIAFGMDESTPWRRSPYGGSHLDRIDDPTLTQKDCIDCHMASTESGRRSHRFPGGHTTFAAMIDAPKQFEANQAIMEEAAVLTIFPMARHQVTAVHAKAQDAAAPGSELLFDVVIANRGAGHNFPSGARDLRDTWLEVLLKDAKGRTLATAGAEHAETGADPTAHRLRALVVNDQGEPVFEHAVADFRVKVYDRTIAPRDADVIRYAWDLPEDLAAERLPLKIEARLKHRRVQPELQKAACDLSKTDRGRVLAKGTEALHGKRPDPCIEQPIVDIATTATEVGAGAQNPNSTEPRWAQLLEHGRGLNHHLQEKLEEAQRAFDAAHKALPSNAPDWARAAILLEQGRVLGKMGRTNEAVEKLDEAAVIMPDHPAIPFAKGKALAQVWRWALAAEAFEIAARRQPNDDRVWRALARSLGSLGRRHASLEAAQRGLRLNGRDPDLLRSQSLAFDKLVPGSPAAEATRAAWLRYRRDDDAPGIKASCKDETPKCQQERVPIFTRPMKTVSP